VPLFRDGSLNELERDLELPDGFFVLLAGEDPWSLVIKSHALLEVAVAHALADALGEPATLEPFSRMEMSNTEVGKLVFAKALRLLEPEHRRFIRALSKLRNTLVHDIRHVGFSFPAHFDAQDTQGKKALASNLGALLREPGWTEDQRRAMVAKNTAFVIWVSTMAVLAFVYVRRKMLESDRKIVELRRLYAEAVSDSSDGQAVDSRTGGRPHE
jgi:hypothetical protein